MICKNCGRAAIDLFCPHCGQKTTVSRFTIGHLMREFLHGFYHFDHGLLFTARELALRPGRTIRNYLRGKRVTYFNPFTFILVLGGINALLLKKLHWQSFFIELGMLDKNAINQAIWDSSLEHFTIRLLLSIPIYSLITFFFYFKKRYTFTEHIVANTYLRGELNLFMILMEPFLLIFQNHSYLMIAKFILATLLVIYTGWSYAGIFNETFKKTGFLKGFLVAFLATSLELVALNLIILKRISQQL